MKTSAQLKAEIEAMQARVQAIVDLANDESRELTSEETTEVDRIQGAGSESGELGSLRAQYDRMLKVEAKVSASLERHLDNTDQKPRQIVVPAIARRTTTLKAFDNTTEGEREAYASGQFLLATIAKRPKSIQWCKDHGYLTNAMSEGDSLKGGNLVPPEYESAIIKRMEEYGVVPRYIRQTSMAGETKSVARRISGLTVYFPGEGVALTDSDMVHNQVNLTAKKATTLTKISSELSEDAVVSMADELAEEIAYAHAVKIDQIAFLGDGTTTYGSMVGLTTALAAGSTATATGHATLAALDVADTVAAVAKLQQVPGIRPVWFVHSAVYWNALARLQLAAGGNNATDLGNGPQLQYGGYPVVFTQALTAAPTTGTVWGYFGDLSMAATMGMRRGLTIAADTSVYFASDQIGIRSTYRYDIKVHETGTASVGGPIIKCVLG